MNPSGVWGTMRRSATGPAGGCSTKRNPAPAAEVARQVQRRIRTAGFLVGGPFGAGCLNHRQEAICEHLKPRVGVCGLPHRDGASEATSAGGRRPSVSNSELSVPSSNAACSPVVHSCGFLAHRLNFLFFSRIPNGVINASALVRASIVSNWRRIIAGILSFALISVRKQRIGSWGRSISLVTSHTSHSFKRQC